MDPQALLPAFNYISAAVAPDQTKFAISIEQVFPPEEFADSALRGAFRWNFRVVPPGGFRCVVEYESNAVDASTVDRWGSDFTNLVLAMTGQPDQAWNQ